jgi:threonylcarbamoyladenosine tRNA methylthiotransferase MtaB
VATFSIENFGCRSTDADASALREELLASGLQVTGEHAQADFVVLNTCTVTAAADSQARDAVRKIHRANPAARIVLTGCYAQRAPEELAALEGVAYVVGNSRQRALSGMVREWSNSVGHESDSNVVPLAQLSEGAMSLARGAAKILTGDIFAETTVQVAPADFPGGGHTRPILKIQDGCNNRCSYCVIPFVRGRSRSLPPETVLEQIQRLVAAGAKEIVLSGINLGSYGRDLSPRVELAALVARILGETSLEQLRFSSIEPQDVTEDFVRLVASSPRLASHFHIPLQSGSDRILRAMHRWYRAEHYAERLQVIRRHLPEAGIGADVIVGFPGETEEDFEATVLFIQRLQFTYLHVFSFSERPGTEAEKLAERVDSRIVRERARHLRLLSTEKSAAFRKSQAGRALRALTLSSGGANWTDALTGNYLKVRVAGKHPANQWREVWISGDAADAVATYAPPEALAAAQPPRLSIRSAAQPADPHA